MLLAFIGGVMVMMSFPGDGVNWFVLILGAVFILLGILSMDLHHDEVKAWHNRQQYWAKGKEPDWKTERNRNRRYCRHCGKLIETGDRFCGHCGNKL